MPTTWEPASVASVTLSGGNLVATNTGTTATNQGAHGLVTDGQTTGQFYFEVTWTTINSVSGSNISIGIGTTASTYTGMGNGATTGVVTYLSSSIFANGSQAQAQTGPWLAGQTCAVAVDLSNRKIWFRVTPSGTWNYFSGTADPVTGVGSIAIPAGTMVPFVTFGGTGGASGNVFTANFGATAFNGAVPAGYIAGFPTAGAGAAAAQARALVLA